MYDFDAQVDWRNVDSVKWNAVKEGVIPLWVADMDFPVFPALKEALVQRASSPFYGYRPRSGAASPYCKAIRSWYKTRHDLELPPESVIYGPGTVLSLGMIVREFSAEGEGVLILTPVYTPFFETIRDNRRKTVEVFLEPDKNGRFILDIPAIENALDRAGVSVPLAIFCSPHNPGGRVWTKEELESLLSLARRRKMLCAFDELHQDFVYAKNSAGEKQRFVSAASLDEYSDSVIVVSGANKSFSLGGLHVSHFVINDETLRAAVEKALYRETHHEGDIFSQLAVETAYSRGGDWFDQCRAYIYDNIRAAVDFLNAGVQGVKAYIPDGTYLIWADVRALIRAKNYSGDTELVAALEDKALVKITPGSMYGSAGEGYVRINTACPRSQLMEGLERIKNWTA